ncbi:Protein of unknown function [Gryllus bimaculatus]|nr:Protein of unknown function [Gryllus bimaculatus]
MTQGLGSSSKETPALSLDMRLLPNWFCFKGGLVINSATNLKLGLSEIDDDDAHGHDHDHSSTKADEPKETKPQEPSQELPEHKFLKMCPHCVKASPVVNPVVHTSPDITQFLTHYQQHKQII